MVRVGLATGALAALLSGFDASCAAPPTEPAKELNPFDGETLTGWTGDPRYWRVEGGAIVGESTAEVPCEATTYLTWTGGALEDFHLELEVRLWGGNSGVQVRSLPGAGFEVTGYQADLDAANEWSGGVYEQGGRGVLVRRGEFVQLANDGGGSKQPLGDSGLELPGLREGQWIKLEVQGIGPLLRISLDGVPTSLLIDEDPARLSGRGLLALQLHAGPPMRVEFRNLRLTRVPPDSPLVGAYAAAPSAAALPQWIWNNTAPRDGERAWLFRELQLESAPIRATLAGSCDNAMTVLLNGALALEGDDWAQPVRAEVARLLRVGSNTLAVAARNETSTAGLQLALEWTDAEGGTHRVVTDESWHADSAMPLGWDVPRFSPRELPRARALAPLGSGQWGSLPPPQEHLVEGALPGTEVELEAGYAVELVLSVPRASYGSWVALTFDERGRAITAAERGGLYRVSLPTHAGDTPAIEVLDDTLGGAQGLLALGADLYVVAHARGDQPSGLYRLRPTESGDQVPPELLLELEGSGEHGPHAVIADESAPGRILLLAGNHTRLVDLARSRVPRVWAEDQVLPRRDDPRGHAVGVLAPGGWVVSLDADGGDAELLACGLRNAYDLAWGPCGELFTYDSDMEWDRSIAWYRPPRFLHLVDGADFGWRHGSGPWPADWPDSLPSVVDTDLASPTGVLFGAGLTGFGARERATLFAGDWAYGRILALELEPRGASFGGTWRTFASGRPLPVTDLAAGPDGWLYFTTGGRGAQSGLYRVRPSAAPPSEVEGLVGESVRGASERAERRALERSFSSGGEGELDAAWRALASEEPFLRHAARVVLEGLPTVVWSARALAETRPRAVAQVVVALAHAGDARRAREAAQLVLGVPLEHLDVAAAVDLLRALALAEMRLGGVPAPERDVLRARLEGLFPRGVDRLDRELARLLVRLDSERVVEAGVDLLERAASSEEATHYAFALVEATAGWTDDLRGRFLAWIDAAPQRYEGGESFGGYVEGLADDAWSRLGAGRVRTTVAAAAVSASASAAARPFVRAWTVEDLAGDLDALRAGRSFERGRDAYVAAQCAACHPIGALGARTGPDLAGTGARFRPAEVLESIVHPSRVVSDQYQYTEVFTLDGELLVGRIAGADDGGLNVRLLPPDERDVWVAASEIESRRLHPLSPMPTGTLDVLERSEILDLLAYVLSGADPDDACFR